MNMRNQIQRTHRDSNFYYNLQQYYPLCYCFNSHNQHLLIQDQQLPKVQKQNELQLENHQVQDQQVDQQQQEYVHFLANKGWWKSLICIMLMNALFILAYLKFLLDSRVSYSDSSNTNNQTIQQNQSPSSTIHTYYHYSPNYTPMIYLMISSLTLINLSYFLTQFLNPGIRNLKQIPDQQFSKAKQVMYCEKCHNYKTQKFTHCSQCQVCIYNYDHHCGFFSKCIGGKTQLMSFYAFLIFVSLGFLSLIACMCIQMGQM